MKDWNYSKHSHIVKQYGGPEKFISIIRAHERQQTMKSINKKWAIGVIPTLTILVPLAAKGAYDLFDKHRQKTIVSDEEAQKAEKELTEHFSADTTTDSFNLD